MRPLIRLLLSALVGASAIGIGLPAQAGHDEDEDWGGYWRGYNSRYHPLRYAPYEPPIYYGHTPPRPYRTRPSYPNPEPAIGSYHPIYGPGRYYGPSIAPYYAPGRDSYGGVKYGWW